MKNVFLILIIKSSMVMAQNYKVMLKKDLLNMIDNMNENFVYYDKETQSKIYTSNNREFILLPASGIKGIVAQERSILDSIIKNGIIPIEEEKPNLFQLEKSRLLNLQDNIEYYINTLRIEIQMPLTKDSFKDISKFKEINKKIRSMNAEEAYYKIFIPLGVIIGEIVRDKINGSWKLDKRYGYNPYYVPYIKDDNNRNYLPWYKLADVLLNKKFNLDQHFASVLTGRDFL